MTARTTDMDLDGARAFVLGLGRFGGGAGAVRFLAERGARVTVLDAADEGELRESIAALHEYSGVEYALGAAHEDARVEDGDLLVVNPAVRRPWEHALVLRAERAGVATTTEIAMLAERLPDRRRVVGVTGTAGKSTTSAMLARALGAGGARVHLGGNIGDSLLPRLDQIGRDDRVVLELSSAQLWWLSRAPKGAWSPGVAVITNLSENHLDWHGAFEHYRDSKLAILAGQQEGDAAVFDPGAGLDTAQPRDGVRHIGPLDTAGVPALRVPGAHNRANAAIALAAARAADPDLDAGAMLRAVSSFEGLPHRLQTVSRDERCWLINDSKCTTPAACALAIEAVRDDAWTRSRRAGIALIAGGDAKGADLAPVIDALGGEDRVYAIGAAADALVELGRAKGTRATRAGDLASACAAIHADHDGRATIVLLSPACASWDQFTNFEQRGERFVELCAGMIGEDAS